MQERLNNLENLMELYASVAEQIATSQQRMRENHLRIAENQRQIAENLLRIDENFNQLEESQASISELLQQVMQAIAVMQADIVRIDETH